MSVSRLVDSLSGPIYDGLTFRYVLHMKSIRLLLKTLTLALFAIPAVAISSTASSWRISSDIDGFGRNNVKVCLYKAGQATDAAWQAIDPATAGNDCHELVVFDLVSRAIYLSFPGSINNLTYFCSSKVKISGRHPCNSTFFVGNASDPDKRALDHALLKDTLVRSGGITMADRMILAKVDAERNDCQRRLDAAGTHQDVQQVMADCDAALGEAGRVQANAKIAQQQKQAEIAALSEYRNGYTLATRTSEVRLLEAFIARYSSNDPERLVPKAIEILAVKKQQDAKAADEARRRESAEAERRAAEMAERQQAQQRNRDLMVLERRISSCKTAIATARAAKAREQAIAASSGYSKPSTLRSAAETEYDCNNIIADSFRQYQQLGGTKSLSSIQ